MKPIQKIFYLFMLVFFVGVIVGCDVAEITLDTPTNVAITDGVLTWNAVANAEKYTVVVGTTNHEVTSTTFDLKTLGLIEGTYQVSVIAVKGTTVSTRSSLVSYVVPSSEPTSLAAPTNVVITNGVVTWNAVPNALSYLVIIGGVEYPTTVRSFDVKLLTLSVGTHQITVKAIRNTLVSSASTAVSYTLEAVSNQGTIYETILLLVNEDYVPDMTEDDFENEWDFRDYERLSRLLLRYSAVAVDAMMTEANAIAMFEHLMSLPGVMENLANPSALKVQLDAFRDFGLTSSSFSYMIMEIAMVAMNIINEEMAFDLLRHEDEIATAEADILLIKQSTAFTQLYAKFASHADQTNLALLDAFLEDQTEQGDAYWVLRMVPTIVNDLLHNYEYHYPWYIYDGNEYIVMLYNILLQARMDEDLAFLNLLNNNPDYVLNPFYNLKNQVGNLSYYNRRIVEIEANMVMLNNMLALMEEERTMFLSSLEDVTEYLTSIYDSIPLTMMTKLDALVTNGELTMEEYFLLKGEIVMILRETLPSAADFANMYTMLIHVAGALGEVSIDNYLTYATTLGQMEYILLDLMLEMVDDIDQTMVEEITAIVDGLIIPGEYIQEEWGGYWTNDQVDFVKAIELAVYIGTYLEDFKAANQLKFTALSLLPLDDVAEELVKLVAAFAKSRLVAELDAEEYEFAAWVIDSVVADFPMIMEGMSVLEGIGANAIAEFLNSEGQFFLDLYEFSQIVNEMEDPALILAEIESLFGGFVAYNSAIMSELDQPSIEKLLRMIRVPLMAVFKQEQMMEPEDFKILFEDLVLPISRVLANVVTLEKQIVLIVAGTEVAVYLDGAWDNIPENELMDAVMSLIVITADQVLTQAIEDMIFASLTILFDDILGNATIMTLTEMDQTTLDDMYSMVFDTLTGMFEDIHTVANFDFGNLTELERDQLYEIFAFLMQEEQPA